jgi:hypothetical protein
LKLHQGGQVNFKFLDIDGIQKHPIFSPKAYAFANDAGLSWTENWQQCTRVEVLKVDPIQVKIAGNS